jgi:hypothetical protein
VRFPTSEIHTKLILVTSGAEQALEWCLAVGIWLGGEMGIKVACHTNVCQWVFNESAVRQNGGVFHSSDVRGIAY